LKDRSGDISALAEFTFGQPFSFEMYMSAGSDGRYPYGYMAASAALTGAIVYGVYPPPLGVDGTDVTGVLVAGIPEPNTALLAAGVLCLLGLARRLR
jgi:hypothetical protein